VSAQRKIVNRNPNRKRYAINRIAEQQATVREEEQRKNAMKQLPPGQERAMKWSGSIQREIQSMLLEVHREMKNMLNESDDFHIET
jgi:hypothetical protein